MLCNERGLQSGSDFYFFTPSNMAKSLFFHLTSCGSFCADFGYQVTRENYYNFLCLYVKEGSLSVTSQEKRQSIYSFYSTTYSDCLPNQSNSQ